MLTYKTRNTYKPFPQSIGEIFMCDNVVYQILTKKNTEEKLHRLRSAMNVLSRDPHFEFYIYINRVCVCVYVFA